MHIKVLGSAAGGGVPQWNCGCANCSAVRAGRLKGRTQSQVAVSSTGSAWILLNASPDLREQLLWAPEFAPANGRRSTPIVAVLLTSADVDCVMGLLHLREFQPFRVFATPSVFRVLTEDNSLFGALERSVPPVDWEMLPLDRPVRIPVDDARGTTAILSCKAVSLGGEFPDYVSSELRKALSQEEAVIGLELVENHKRFFFAPSLPSCGEAWKRSVMESELAFLDGTFWTDQELIDIRGNGKTAREIGHLPVSGASGLLEQLQFAKHVRRVLIHVNNTNPVLNEDSAASRTLRDTGWEVAYDGMEFEL